MDIVIDRIDQNKTIAELLSPIKVCYSIFKWRDLLLQSVKHDVQKRYKSSMLGLFWVFATPLCMLAVYTFVFSVVFEARWGTEIEDSKTAFALTMFCGLLFFRIFSESITDAASVVVGNPNYVKKVAFPLEVLPVISLLAAFFFGLIWICILLLGIAVFMHKLCLTMICLPLILLPLFLICCGLCWFLASLGVYVRDLPHAVGVFLQMFFFMTPIFYSLEMIPEPYRTLLRLNPLTDIIQNGRKILIYEQWPDWTNITYLVLCSVVVFQLGYVWFMKTKRGFADVL